MITNLNPTQKTSITIILSLIISFSIVFLVVEFTVEVENDVNKEKFESEQEYFQSEGFDYSGKKIFLIGSSQIGRFNETAIQENLLLHDLPFNVYNLAKSADTPKQRLKSIDEIISVKPEMILYGLGYRDFGNIILESSLEKPQSILPDPYEQFVNVLKFIEESLNYDFDRINSPRTVTINALKEILEDKAQTRTQLLFRPHSPFYHTDELNTIILNDFELKRSISALPYKLDKISDPASNDDVKAMIKIIKKIQETDIKLIIISMPHTKYYINSITEYNQKQYDPILNIFEEQYSIPLYQFNEKYFDENIWNANDHIAIGKNILPNIDLSNIILNEIDS